MQAGWLRIQAQVSTLATRFALVCFVSISIAGFGQNRGRAFITGRIAKRAAKSYFVSFWPVNAVGALT